MSCLIIKWSHSHSIKKREKLQRRFSSHSGTERYFVQAQIIRGKNSEGKNMEASHTWSWFNAVQHLLQHEPLYCTAHSLYTSFRVSYQTFILLSMCTMHCEFTVMIKRQEQTDTKYVVWSKCKWRIANYGAAGEDNYIAFAFLVQTENKICFSNVLTRGSQIGDQ